MDDDDGFCHGPRCNNPERDKCGMGHPWPGGFVVSFDQNDASLYGLFPVGSALAAIPPKTSILDSSAVL
jgi:hypothetical protein